MRLTKKSDKLGYCLRHSSISANKCWKKLGQLEDILEKYAICDIEQLDHRLEESVADFTYLGYGKRKVKDYYDLEQELGIDLITLFKALKQEVLFIKTDFDIRETIKNGEGWGMKHLSFEDGELVIFAQIMYPNDITYKEWVTPLRLKLKDYGKTWALTKEELE